MSLIWCHNVANLPILSHQWETISPHFSIYEKSFLLCNGHHKQKGLLTFLPVYIAVYIMTLFPIILFCTFLYI